MIFLLPTDTCYGLAGEFNEQDYNEIYRLKGRDFVKPLAWLVHDYGDLHNYIEITDEQIEILKKYNRPWSILGRRRNDFILPDFLDAKMYDKISLRVARVCLKSLPCSPDKGRCPTVSVEGRGVFVGRGVSYISYRKDLTEKAQENRKNMNIQERKMWYDILHSEKLKQYKFTRQKPLGEYIVDFYCQEFALVIEIDGESHIDQIEYDQKRTNFLESYKLRVLRFHNDDLIKNIEGVFQKVCECIDIQKQTPLNPPLSGGPPESSAVKLPLLRESKPFPLFLTSANLSGEPESTTFTEAREHFPGIDGYDAGICNQPPSDIFSFGVNNELIYIRKNEC